MGEAASGGWIAFALLASWLLGMLGYVGLPWLKKRRAAKRRAKATHSGPVLLPLRDQPDDEDEDGDDEFHALPWR